MPIKGALLLSHLVHGHTRDQRPNHLSAWRRLAKEGKLVVPDLAGVEFAPVLLEPEASKPVTASAEAVEITHGATLVRLDAETPPARIAEIVHALNGAS